MGCCYAYIPFGDGALGLRGTASPQGCDAEHILESPLWSPVRQGIAGSDIRQDAFQTPTPWLDSYAWPVARHEETSRPKEDCCVMATSRQEEDSGYLTWVLSSKGLGQRPSDFITDTYVTEWGVSSCLRIGCDIRRSSATQYVLHARILTHACDSYLESHGGHAYASGDRRSMAPGDDVQTRAQTRAP